MSIGQPLARIEGREKVTGAACYAADFSVPEMLHGMPVTAAVPAGRVVSIQAGRACEELGVVRVITHVDMLRLQVASIPPLASSFLPMQGDEIRYQGQPIAVVLAESIEAAAHGARLVKVEYEAATFKADAGETDLQDAKSPAEPYLFGTPATFAKGNFERDFAAALVRQETTYVQPARHHNPMETSATLAEWDGQSLTLHDAVQAGFHAKAALAAIFQLHPDRVRVICRHTGGGFGCKGYVWPHEIIAAAAAMIAKRPVRIQLTRAQQYETVGYQARTMQTIALAADNDGRLRAIGHDCANTTGISDDFVELGTEAGRAMYAADAIQTRLRVMPRHVNLPTPMRAPVEGVGMWALESAMNELAHRLRIDPLDLRLRNYADVDPTDGKPWSSKKLREAYETGARLFGWRERPQKPARDGPWLVGQGMASCTMGCFRNPWKARLTVRDDGSALIESGFHDIGTGTQTIAQQIAADALGIDPAAVIVEFGDTQQPESGPTYGSSAAMGVGGALLDAARKIRSHLTELSGVAAETTRSSAQSTLQLLRAARVDQFAAEGEFKPQDSPRSLRTFGAIFVEVGVDAQLGVIRLRRAVGSYSAGRIINPRTARSQIIGGIVWGWGKATMEESRYEPRLGRWLAKNLSNVAIPVNADIPDDITVHFVEEFDADASPIGGKGIGELAATGVDAAIADAVFHATGKRIRELPITPAKLMR